MTTPARPAVPCLIALPELLARGRNAAHPVARDGDQLIVWADFAARVVALSQRLRATPAMRWLLASDDALTFAVQLFAALHAGKQAVIPPNTLPGTLAALAGAYDQRFTDSDALPATATAPAAAAETVAPARLPALDARASIIDIYTSGSTGEHKRIRKTLAQFDAEMGVLEALWGDRVGAAAVVATAPHQHIYGLLFRLFWPLASGRVFDARNCAQPDVLAARLSALAPALLISSPAQLTRLPELLPLAELPQPPVAVFSSGGPLPAAAAHAIARALGQAPIEIFGSTETGGVAWRQRQVSATDEADDEAWTPFPGHTLSCAADGALTLYSAFLADGGPWRMDDAIELLADGRFRLRGRLDRVVKIEEKRLALPDMEARLAAHAWVDAAAVVALATDSGRRQTLGAVVVLNARGRARLRGLGRRALAQLLRRHLAAYFDAILLPRRWRFPLELPRNERGKLTNAALQQLFSVPESDDAPAGDGDPALLPSVERVTYADDANNSDAVLVDLHVAPTIAYFAGHFPGAALLPGVVQIDWAVRLARRYLAVEGTFSALDNVKFLGVVLPDTHLKLSLAWDGERRRLDFAYSDAQRRYSTGRIVLAGQR